LRQRADAFDLDGEAIILAVDNPVRGVWHHSPSHGGGAPARDGWRTEPKIMDPTGSTWRLRRWTRSPRHAAR
jgi:hypothetical protein